MSETRLEGRPASIEKALRRALSKPAGDGRRVLDVWADSVIDSMTDPAERRALLEALGMSSRTESR